MESKFLSQENIFGIASIVYRHVKQKYKINAEGKYLQDIQKVMHNLWAKNKTKKLKKGQSPEKFFMALNKKTLDIILPQITNSIEGGVFSHNNNSLFLENQGRPQYNDAHSGYDIPRPSTGEIRNDDVNQRMELLQRERDNIYNKPKKVTFQDDVQQIEQNMMLDQEDPNAIFERLRKEREMESQQSLNQMTGVPNNRYSTDNYQNNPQTYENHIPQTERIMPKADQYNNGQPVNNNIPMQHPSLFKPTSEPIAPIQNPGPNLSDPPAPMQLSDPVQDTYEHFFTQNSNIQTNIQSDNDEVIKRFEDMKAIYEQEGTDQKDVKDTTNRVEDLFGKNLDTSAMFKQFNDPSQNQSVSQGNLDTSAMFKQFNDPSQNQSVSQENFTFQEKENKVEIENKKRAELELTQMNQLTNNAYVNYSLIPPEKLNYITRKYYVTVDSLQRDLEIYPLPTNFQVRFEQPDEVVEIPSYLNANGVVIYEKPIVYQSVGGKGAKLENVYENVVELKCLDAQIPFDRYFVGGKSPYNFNGPEFDENKLIPNKFNSYPYGPVWESDYGIEVDLFDEPYYFLIVDEIDGAYDGTNFASRRALAKLNYEKIFGLGQKFINLRTTLFEGKLFYPTTLSKLAQMTLQLVTRFNKLVNLGIDKVYIEKIEQGEENTGKYCNIKKGDHLTKITIIPDDPSYGVKLCSHGNFPADRLLFYSIFNCDVIKGLTPLSQNIYINFSQYPVLNLYMVSEIDGERKDKKIDVSSFLGVGDILVLNKSFLLDIVEITNDGILLRVDARQEFDPSTKITNKAFIKKKLRGTNSEDIKDFTSESGHRIGGDLSESYSFQIFYPYECLPNYLRSDNGGFYKSREAFYIHAKKQITYTFEITQVEKNMQQLDSRIT
jgi:hypothetical protein